MKEPAMREHAVREPAVSTPQSGGRAQGVVRRIIVLVVLYALVVIAAIGLSGLVERVLGGPALIAEGSGTDLARALAFALIAGPLAAALWWWESRRLADPADPSERDSVMWGLYLLAMTLTALITATIALGGAAVAGIDARWDPAALATGLVWAVVWVLHLLLRRSTLFAPARLGAVTAGLSAVWGLAVGAWGAVTALARLIADALDATGALLVTSQHSAVPVLQAAVWAVIGAAIWWWHWHREGGARAAGGFAAVLLVAVASIAAAAALFALGTVLHVVLRLVFRAAPTAEVLAPLDTALATALVAGIVWAYHAGLMQQRTAPVRRAARLALSGIGLIGAASGFGVVVNALLATAAPTLADSSPLTLLLGGLSALIVGAPVWWLAWRPAHAAVTADTGGEPGASADDRARRIYLVVVFGASAIAAIVALLTIAYRLFEFWIDPAFTQGLLDYLRAPLGVLVATALVFAYHFAVWLRTRPAAVAAADRLAIGRIVLVAAGDADAAARTLRASTGVPVEVWPAADGGAQLAEADATVLAEALRGVQAPRVLVLAEPSGPRIVPIAR